MQHYSKRSSFAEKVLFSKNKKKGKEKTRLDDLDLTFFLTLQALQPALFFCRCSARSARSCPSGRFSLLFASRCSFKILLQYPWKLQRSRTKSQILQPCDPGLSDESPKIQRFLTLVQTPTDMHLSQRSTAVRNSWRGMPTKSVFDKLRKHPLFRWYSLRLEAQAPLQPSYSKGWQLDWLKLETWATPWSWSGYVVGWASVCFGVQWCVFAALDPDAPRP